ncbi:MAG TPA: peptidylprolyl isomerase [Labilithrix sp.]
METIQPNARVLLDYVLTGEDGRVIDQSDAPGNEPIAYVHGYGMIVPGLEAALVGLRAGEEKKVVLTPAEGFGERDEELVLEVDREELPRPKEVMPGDELVAESPDGEEVALRVVEVKSDCVVVDANHPLAGLTLQYVVKVREIRPATEDELEAAAEAFEEAGYDAEDEPVADEKSGLVQLTPKKTRQK